MAASALDSRTAMALAMEGFEKHLEVVRQEKKAQTSNIISKV
jgi:hypothetical protein